MADTYDPNEAILPDDFDPTAEEYDLNGGNTLTPDSFFTTDGNGESDASAEAA